jgi:hypothetical protein
MDASDKKYTQNFSRKPEGKTRFEHQSVGGSILYHHSGVLCGLALQGQAFIC